MITSRQRRWSRCVWGAWLAAFLGLEISGWQRARTRVPWVTLSETAWDSEAEEPWLYTGLLGFLIGLAVHIRQRRHFGRAETGGLLIALVMRKFWND